MTVGELVLTCEVCGERRTALVAPVEFSPLKVCNDCYEAMDQAEPLYGDLAVFPAALQVSLAAAELLDDDGLDESLTDDLHMRWRAAQARLFAALAPFGFWARYEAVRSEFYNEGED